MLYKMVKERSVRFSLWSGQQSGQTRSNLVKVSPNSRKRIPDHVLRVSWVWWTPVGSGTVWSNLSQTWSTSVKLGQTWSKLSELWEMYPTPRFEDFYVCWTLVGSETAWSNLGQTWSTLGQTWSTLGKLSRISGNAPQTPF